MIDNALRNFINKEWTLPGIFRGKKISTLDILLLLGMTWAGIMLRYSCRDVETLDYTVCFVPWIDAFKTRGIGAFSDDAFDYTMPYMTFLYLTSKTGFNPLYAIKVFSSIFDLILAVFCGLIVNTYTNSRTKSFLASGIFFCLPTVAVNSGLWGQCDAIYVSFIVIAFYFIIKDRPHLSMLFYGIAFAIKLQTLFVFPFFVFLWVRKKIDLWQFLYIPGMYLVLNLPGLLVGRSLSQILGTYIVQGNTEPWMLSWYWPNIYQLFGPMAFWEYYSTAGIIGTVSVLMLLLYFLVHKKISTSPEMMLKIILMFAWVVPFFLPYMHERYAYLADVLAFILFFIEPKKFLLPLLGILCSFVAYTGYLNDGSVAMPGSFFCFIMAGLVAYSVWQVFSDKPITSILSSGRIPRNES